MKMPANPYATAYTGMLMAGSYWLTAWRELARQNEKQMTQAKRITPRPSSPRTPRPAQSATAR